MADDYARHARSQRAAFDATQPAALATARLFADEPVLRVVDLGAADGVNSHGLVRNLMEVRAGRPLIYALVDLPTNTWAVAAEHAQHAFGELRDGPGVVVIPGPGDASPGSPTSARESTGGRLRPTVRPAAGQSSTVRTRPQ